LLSVLPIIFIQYWRPDVINFGGEEVVSSFQDSEIHILPVPYDATSSWMKGSEKGPSALLDASPNLEFYDIITESDIRKRGIYTLDPVVAGDDPDTMVAAVRKAVDSILEGGRFPVIIGGNHSVPIGSMQAFASRYDKLTILQLDAHSDLRPEYLGSPYNHASVMARASELAPVVQVGIRSMCEEELPYADHNRIFYAHQLYEDPSLYDEAVDMLTSNVYVTIDLDVFDPSIMPSTGTPEPGGLMWYDVTGFLAKVAARKRIVGFDIVELCPNPANKAPDFMAAKLLYHFLSLIFSHR
jgi:agmatinase